MVLQRKTEDGEYVEVGQLGPSDYFGNGKCILHSIEVLSSPSISVFARDRKITLGNLPRATFIQKLCIIGQSVRLMGRVHMHSWL